MVSIPDWSRFRGLGDSPTHTDHLASTYQKQRVLEAIKQADEHGYFNTPTKEFIVCHCFPDDKDDNQRRKVKKKQVSDKSLSDLWLMKLPYLHLRTIADIGQCINLKICILNNNYITRFDALAPCVHLVKLDLHSNQITHLPSDLFWSEMVKLQILHLHDNPVGAINNLQSLSHCCNLMALTLHNTPLSLKPNYRHHVVNSILSLKALDHHIISDEEIIEDADFSEPFSALHPSCKINLCSSKGMETDDLRSVYHIIRKINQKMAHTSPVLILQRYMRGHLIRKRFNILRELHIWAAVTIQRKYRNWKRLPTYRMDLTLPPLPTYDSNKEPSILVNVPDKLDYDTYLQNRRPGSPLLSEHSARQPPMIRNTPEPEDLEDQNKKNLFINLARLQSGGTQTVADGCTTDRRTDETTQGKSTPRKTAGKKKDAKLPPVKRFKSIKQFLGPVVDMEPCSEESFEDDVPITNFRLRGHREDIVCYDATTEMLMARREAGQKVRSAEDKYHEQLQMRAPPLIKPSQKKKHMFGHGQGTMGLTCLQTIQQAYTDRAQAEKRAHQVQAVVNMREHREAAKERIKLYKEDRRNKIIQQRDHEEQQLMDKIDHRIKHNINTVKRYQELSKLTSSYQKSRREELTFMVDFGVQNTSVSNALLRHDWQARVDDRNNSRTAMVQSQRDIEREQQDVVKRYLEHRQLMRQTESAMSRAAVDTKMLQDANEKLIQAKSRVEQQQNRNERVNTFYPLPCVSNQPLPGIESSTQIGSVSMKNFVKWNADKLVRYNTVATMQA